MLAVPEHLVVANQIIAPSAQKVLIQGMDFRPAFLAIKENIQTDPDLLSAEFALLDHFQRKNPHHVASETLILHQT